MTGWSMSSPSASRRAGASIHAAAGMLRSRIGVGGRSSVCTGVGSMGRLAAGIAPPGVRSVMGRRYSRAGWKNADVRVTAKVDYAVRASIVLARAARDGTEPVKGERIRTDQDIPFKFCENILGELRQDGLVRSQRG